MKREGDTHRQTENKQKMTKDRQIKGRELNEIYLRKYDLHCAIHYLLRVRYTLTDGGDLPLGIYASV